MPKLRELEPIVKQVLENSSDARKDDFSLLYKVYKTLCPNIEDMSFKTAMLCHKQLQLPSFESITRCRRKVQEQHPELRDEYTVDLRVEEQEGYIKYALNV